MKTTPVSPGTLHKHNTGNLDTQYAIDYTERMIDVVTESEGRKNLATNVMHILRARGISQSDLARATKRSVMTISLLCRGMRLPNVVLASEIAEVLGYAVEDMIGSPEVIAARERCAGRRKFLTTAS